MPLPFPNPTAFHHVGTFATGGLTISPTASTITSTLTLTPGTGGIPGFPSSGGTTLNLLVLATDANGYSVGFVIPPIVVAP